MAVYAQEQDYSGPGVGYPLQHNDMVAVRELPVRKITDDDTLEIRDTLYRQLLDDGYDPSWAKPLSARGDSPGPRPVRPAEDVGDGMGVPEETVDDLLDGRYEQWTERVEEPATSTGAGTKVTTQEYFEADRPWAYIGFVSDDAPDTIRWGLL